MCELLHGLLEGWLCCGCQTFTGVVKVPERRQCRGCDRERCKNAVAKHSPFTSWREEELVRALRTWADSPSPVGPQPRAVEEASDALVVAVENYDDLK